MFARLVLAASGRATVPLVARSVSLTNVSRTFTSTSVSRGMEEFLPREVKEGEPVQSAGRAWLASELRLKSFDDLHRLWFVCLKERNMLLTERLYFKQVGQSQPDPHRLSKVKKTMARIRVVLWERARAREAMERDAAIAKLKEEVAPVVAGFSPDTPAIEIADSLVKERVAARKAAEAAVREAKKKEVVVTFKKFGRKYEVPASEAPEKMTRQQRAKIARKAAYWSKVTGWRQELVESLAPVGVEVPPLRPKPSASSAPSTTAQ